MFATGEAKEFLYHHQHHHQGAASESLLLRGACLPCRTQSPGQVRVSQRRVMKKALSNKDPGKSQKGVLWPFPLSYIHTCFSKTRQPDTAPSVWIALLHEREVCRSATTEGPWHQSKD